jgi:PAS domain S-box-containing protein
VIVTRDVDAEKKSAERVEAARAYAEGVIDTVRDGLVVLDGDLRIASANKAFLKTFRSSSENIEGRRLEELGRPELAAPLLRKLLGELETNATVEGFRIEPSDEAGGSHTFLLNARRIEKTELLLLAFEDVTLVEHAEKKIQAYQEELHRMSFEAAVTEERERRRIATELHDRMGQALALAEIKLTSVRGELTGEARSAVDGAVELLEQAIGDARTLIFDLSPPILYDLGLGEALAWLAEDLEKRHGIKVEVTDDGASKPLDDAAKGVVFRAVRELLMNVLKHAKAPAAKVSLTRTDNHCRIEVEDRGAGFDPDVAIEPGTVGGFGLLSVRAQVTRLGGILDVKSAPGRGTLVSIHVPLGSSAPPPNPRDDVTPGDEGTP